MAKVKADGSDLVYLGYIGGAGDDVGESIAIDSAGNAYITGRTDSDQTTFPVKVGPDQVHGGGGNDAFVAKVKADATGLETTFPVKVAPDLIHGSGDDAFVAKVKPDGSGLLYPGHIGGAGLDSGSGIAVDAAGNAYVAGRTSSDQTSFPVTVGPDLNFSGGSDAFVAKVPGKPDLSESAAAVEFFPSLAKPGDNYMGSPDCERPRLRVGPLR